jgi:hypothetical protein
MTPISTQAVIVSKPNGDSAAVNVTAIRLQINELDSDTAGTDTMEFVEISTGVPNVSLAGYTLVFWNGSSDVSYVAIELNATTDANGLLLVGNSLVVPTPALTFMDNVLQNGQDAVSVHQALPAAFPVSTPVTAANVIDALVYDTADVDDPGLLATLMTVAVQVDENVNLTSATDSIMRCGDGRRDGSKYSVGTPPSPGALNTVTACP